MIGFTTEAQKEAKLIAGAYTIVTKGEETVVSYIQPEAPNDGSKYNLITFNSLNPNAQ